MDFAEFSDVLIYITGGQDPITNTSEVAIIMDKTRETVYGYRSGNYEPPISSVRSLHQWLVKEYNCYVVERYMNPQLDMISNNDVRDNLWAIHEDSTDIARLYEQAKKGDVQAQQQYFDYIEKMKNELYDLKAEGEVLRKQAG